jgi:sugar transferase (PEP-CTERM system associated)
MGDGGARFMPLKLFDTYLRPPVQLLALVETSIIFGGVFAAVLFRFHGEPAEFTAIHGAIWPKAAVIAVVVFISLVALGLYQLRQRLHFKDTLARVAVALLLASVALTAIWYLFPGLTLGRGVGAVTASIAFSGLLLVRYYFLRTVDENIFRRRTLIVGNGDRCSAIDDIRRRADRRGFRVVGQVCTPDAQKTCTSDRCLGHERSLLELALEQNADEIVVAMNDRRGNLPLDQLMDCKVRGIDVLDLLGFLERETGKVRIEFVNPSWFIFSGGFRVSLLRRVIKRGVDIAVAATALIVAAPILVLAAIAIRVEDGPRAPVFYRQRRVGYHGQTFSLLKFRSMIVTAEEDGEARWAAKDDPRITRVGRVLRQLRIDELPQMINVLHGKMSLVGPRPERPEFVCELIATIPFYAERHTVKPGVTGWAQLKYQYGSTEQDAIEKLQYDLYYVKNHNLLLDVAIMLQTAEVVLWGKGAR